VWPPYRIWTKTKPEDALILGVFLLIGVSGFFVEGFRIALVGRPTFEKWSIVGWPISAVFDGMSPPPCPESTGHCGACTSPAS